jgi:hypothetical protein
MRTVVIGDVHGCLDELTELVRRCGGRRGARVVLVGDLVAKGPDSAGVVQWAREEDVTAVLGNHDAHVLCLRPGAEARRDDGKSAKADHVAVARDLGPKDWDWLAARPLWTRLEDGDEDEDDDGAGHLVVHGGLVPGVPLAEQRREHLLNLRSFTADGEPSRRLDGVPWASRWRGPAHVVFGHDATRGLQRHPFATGLDTGCVYGRELTALVLPEGKLVSVHAHRAYCPMG